MFDFIFWTYASRTTPILMYDMQQIFNIAWIRLI